VFLYVWLTIILQIFSTQDQQYSLSIVTQPSGASAYVDNRFEGYSPTVIPIEEGTHNLRISLIGYRSVEEQINVLNRSSTLTTPKK
jgi:hypothetical protein